MEAILSNGTTYGSGSLHPKKQEEFSKQSCTWGEQKWGPENGENMDQGTGRTRIWLSRNQ